jgi:uncharacterized phosphosugar-binding protein
MQRKLHLILNATLVSVICGCFISSCAGIVSPGVVITGKVNDKDVKVVIYPDGSKPTEVDISDFTNKDGNIVIDLPAIESSK